MSDPRARVGDASRVVRDVVRAAGDDAVRACGELRRPRLVYVSAASGFVVRWPDASEHNRRWLATALRRRAPAWLHVPWAVVS